MIDRIFGQSNPFPTGTGSYCSVPPKKIFVNPGALQII